MTGNRVLMISAGILQQMLAKGYERRSGIRVTDGPDPEARIIGVEWDAPTETIRLVYDRDVPDTSTLQSFELASIS